MTAAARAASPERKARQRCARLSSALAQIWNDRDTLHLELQRHHVDDARRLDLEARLEDRHVAQDLLEAQMTAAAARWAELAEEEARPRRGDDGATRQPELFRVGAA